MPTVSAILFDKDGTLFDYHRTWAAWSKRFLLDLAGHNWNLARVMARAVNFDLDTPAFRADSVLVRDTPHAIAEALLPYLPGGSMTSILRKMTEQTATVRQEEASPLVPLMAELRQRGLALGVVTNDSETPARAHLEAAGVHDAFDHILGCDSGFAPKPQPDMLLAFSEMTGICPSETVMVGDSSHDMKAGRSAGMTVLAVLTGVADRKQLEPHSDHILPSIAGLPTWLDGFGGSEVAA